MKKNVLKTLLALITVFSVIFVGCAGDAGDTNSEAPAKKPGTLGEISAPLLGAAELLEEIDPNNEKVIFFYYRPDGNYSDWGLWLWEDAGNGTDDGFNLTKGKFEGKNITVNNQTFNIGCMVLTSEMFEEKVPAVANVLNDKKNLNFIIRTDGWTAKDPGPDQAFDLSGGTHFMVVSGDTDVYPISSVMTPFISSANMETTTTMKVALSTKYALETTENSNGFIVTASDGTIAIVKDIVNYNAQNNRNDNFTNTLLVRMSSPLDMSKTWSISHEKFEPSEGRIVGTANAIKISLNDFVYEGTDLGLTLNGNKATFKVWAPVASDVTILLYDDVSKVGNYKAETLAYKVAGSTTEVELKGTPSKEAKMTLDTSTGVWSYVIEDVSAYKYYKYQITNNGTTTYVCDIYAKAASPDSIAAQIIDINQGTNYGSKDNYVNPFGNNGTDSKLYSDAIIYEMHIRDWSRAAVADSTGKFLDIANSDEIINHLKDIGITHVQILPMFDYAQVNSDLNYNWGYNPYHYNVPEGRYVEYSTGDGIDAVNQMRSMIEKLHEAGIAVIMDVVYNHTSGTQGGSLYDSTVPYYYYRLNADGSYSNGSGCGNETDSEAPMFKKYMIETLKHWMLDYHINGFRFDLMGLHSKETMAEIYKELSAIDSNVLVYGEPWTGGDARVKNGCTGSVPSETYGVGAFDDDFRDAIKGAEFGGFNAGEVQGVFNSEGISAGLKGESGKNGRNTTDFIGLGLHYVECHDNFTLFDKLVYSLEDNIDAVKEADDEGKIATKWPATITLEQIELIKKEQTLAGAYVMLSQGTAFMNGGQEFLRTKKGNPDSYSADTKGGVKWTNDAGDKNIDDVNTIDLTFKETYSDVYKTYKGLIAFRKQYSSLFGSFTKTNTQKPKNSDKNRVDGVTKYCVEGTADNFLIYFNATEEEFVPLADDIKDYTKVIDVTSGTPTESTTLPTSVPAKSFVILKK